MNITKLNNIVTSEKNIAFNITVDGNKTIYFGDLESSEKFNDYYNYNMLALSSSSGLMHNMFDAKDVFFKSALYLQGKANRNNTTYDFYPITNHRLSSNLTNIIQTNGVFYSLGNFTTYGKYTISDDIYSFLSIDNGYSTLPPINKIETIIQYNVNYIQTCLDQKKAIDPISAVLTKTDKIQYNTIFEFPGNIQNDYQSTNIAANVFKCKNQYNSIYDMSHSVEAVLSNARNYISINSCNNQLYLKYYDNINYLTDGNYSMQQCTKNIYNCTYQHVEKIEGFNRSCQTNAHKANLYSISIRTNIIKNLNDTIKDNVKSEIKNIVRTIAEKLQPANIQLFGVYVSET